MNSGAGAQLPKVWLLLGHKAGDNSQVRSLAAALDWPTETRRLRYRRTEVLSNRLFGPTLLGIDPASSDALSPPWPDLVITSGRRNEPVARWIKRESGGACRLVHLGRPWAAADEFDLVITTPQYALRPGPGVVQIGLPLHGVNAATLATAASRWSGELAALPSPRVVVLAGGNSGSFLLTADRARRLRRVAEAMARRAGGSLLVSDSARTPAAARRELFADVDLPHRFFRWGTPDQDNPYLGFLALGDQFVVTGDSVSMVAEACATGKPVYLLHPGRHPLPLGEGSGLRPDWLRPGWYRWRPVSHRLGMAIGPRRLRRDVPALLQKLVDRGQAAWLGGEPPARPASGDADLRTAVTAVRRLLGAAD